MKVTCSSCKKTFNIPDERLPQRDSIAFPCPACKGTISLDLSFRKTSAPDLSNDCGQGDGRRSNGSQKNGWLRGEELKKKILATVRDIPPMPQTMFKAHELIKDPNTNFEMLAKILETDQAIATRVLRMANAPLFGMSGKVSSLKMAAALLGTKTLEELIAAAGSSRVLNSNLEGYGQETGALWQHSLGVAFGAKIIAAKKRPDLVNEAFSAGLIHDIGKLVLDPFIAERREAFAKFMQEGNRTFLEAEKDILGFNHAEMASELCLNWRVPTGLVTAIAYHHVPVESNGDELAYIVHVADSMTLMSGLGVGMDGIQYNMDMDALKMVGIKEDDVPEIMINIVMSVQQILEEQTN